MTLWIIEPRDPLIVRDGRPFGPNPGARATTLLFPFPSTIAGALRTKAGLSSDGTFDTTSRDTVCSMSVYGPLLVQLSDDDAIEDWFLPAPADALLLDPETATGKGVDQVEKRTQSSPNARRRWLAPRELTAITNMPDALSLVNPAEPTHEKVSTAAPRFWYRDIFWQWLNTPADSEQPLDSLGIRGLEMNTRMHVSIESGQQTAREGALFQTSGLEFTWRDWKQAEHNVFATKRLALAAWFDGSTPHFDGGFAPMGGERRLMCWYKADPGIHPFDDTARDSIFSQIKQDRRCRVILLTPAIFADGYRPPLEWMRGGVTARLVAAAVPRAQVVSGWDLAANNGRGAPKPTRRLAPAGSVYFVEFLDGADTHRWLEATWMHNVSDADQDQKDGFGLAVVGAWPK